MSKNLENLMLKRLASDVVSEAQEAESEILSNPKIFKKDLMDFLKTSKNLESQDQEKLLQKIVLLLGVMGERQALSCFYKLVLDDSRELEVRARVVRAISEIVDGRDVFDEAATDVFNDLVSSPKNLIRGFSAKIFVSLGGAWAGSMLNKLALDPDAWVRQKASEALIVQS